MLILLRLLISLFRFIPNPEAKKAAEAKAAKAAKEAEAAAIAQTDVYKRQDLVYAWDNAEIGMMDASLAAKIMYADADAAELNEKAAQYRELQMTNQALNPSTIPVPISLVCYAHCRNVPIKRMRAERYFQERHINLERYITIKIFCM